jgi:hypothetical protein
MFYVINHLNQKAKLRYLIQLGFVLSDCSFIKPWLLKSYKMYFPPTGISDTHTSYNANILHTSGQEIEL